MKVVILAGGLGARLSEETTLKPKPMVEIGGKPMLWHILKIYSHYGFNEFVILLGYKGYMIKEYFCNYFIHENDIEIDIEKNKVNILNNASEPWKITLINTGEKTMTGGRIKKVQNLLDGKPFMLTYGDGVCDIPIDKLLEYHKTNGKTVTLSAVQQEGRFGSIELDNNNMISKFTEKPKNMGTLINGGFFVCEPQVFDHISDDDSISFEREPLESLAKSGELCAYRHNGFWKCMDTLRDKKTLNTLWNKEIAPWKIWT